MDFNPFYVIVKFFFRMQKIDLSKLAERYGYTPPEPEPRRKPFDFSAVDSQVRSVLEDSILRSDFRRFYYGGVEFTFPSEGTALKLSFFQPGSHVGETRSFPYAVYIDFTKADCSWSALAQSHYQGTDTSTWTNIHRVTSPPYRNREIATRFQEYYELMARTQAFVDQKPRVLTAEPDQTDVVNFFAARGFEAEDPARLQGFVSRQSSDYALSDRAFGTDERRPWSMWKDKLWMFRVPMRKVIAAPADLEELKQLNKTA